MPTDSQNEHAHFSKLAKDCIEADNAAHAADDTLYHDWETFFLENISAGLAIGETISPLQRDKLNALYAKACESKY